MTPQKLYHWFSVGAMGVDTEVHPFGIWNLEPDELIDAADSTYATYGGYIAGGILHNLWGGYLHMLVNQYQIALKDERSRDYAVQIIFALQRFAQQRPEYHLIPYIGHIQDLHWVVNGKRYDSPGLDYLLKRSDKSDWLYHFRACIWPCCQFSQSIAFDASAILPGPCDEFPHGHPGRGAIDTLIGCGMDVWIEAMSRDAWGAGKNCIAMYEVWKKQTAKYPLERTGRLIVPVLPNDGEVKKDEAERRANADEVIAAGHDLAVIGKDMSWATQLITRKD